MDPQRTDLESALRESFTALSKAEQRADQCTEEARRASEEMQQMLYAVGHDLRAPLRAVLSYAQLLQRHLALDENATELTAFIVNGANEMNTLIEGLLKYSRLGSGGHRTSIGLGALVQFALFNLQTEIQKSGAQVIFEDLPKVSIDEAQFVQLFQQLIGNAIKFRGSETPRIEITGSEEGDQYCCEVRDNSAGIQPEYHEMIFTPFKRLHGKEVPGLGLGLAACRKVLRAHGGRIWVESSGSDGSVFKFTLPKD